jgi:HD-GYP domain-containing protein (c-di-GMP phosphodiesterase class II)/ABC-type amino acid transport substrate-binding protein
VLLLSAWKRFRFSIYSTVISVFLFAALLISGVSVGLHYYFSKSFATDSALSVYEQTATSTHDFVENLDERAEEIAFMLAKFPQLIHEDSISEETRAVFAEVLTRNPLISFITVGFHNGGFYQLVNLDANVKTRQQFTATAKDKWVVITVRTDGARYLHFDYLDEAFQHRHEVTYPTNYDVRTRSWFEDAVAGEVTKSQPYLFQHLQIPGQVYSIGLSENKHVLALGIALPSLSDFLKKQPLQTGSEVYIYQQNGEVIASNNFQQDRLLPSAPKLSLTAEQQLLVQQQPYLTVSNELDWPPINFASAGQPRGYSIDVLAYIAEMTGFQLRYVNGLGWDEMTQLFVSNELDIVQPVFFNVTRGAVGNLSEAFLRAPYGIVAKKALAIKQNASELVGLKVAIQRGWSLAERVQYHYPQIDVVLVDSVAEMFEVVETGEVDAGIDTQAVLDYYLNSFLMSDVVAISPLSFEPHRFSTDLHFMVNPALPGVTALINQALAALDTPHKEALYEKWFSGGKRVSKPMLLPYPELITMTENGEIEGLKTVSLKGEDYFVYAAPMDVTDKATDYLMIMTPVEAVRAESMGKVATSIWVTAGAIVLLLPLIWLTVAPIARSIRILAEDSEKIKQRRYKEVKHVDSRITEINDLATSVMTMSGSIREHEASQQALIESFIELIAQAIDDKSTHTAGHCERVPELAFMLAEAANKSNVAPFKQFEFKNEDEWREFRIGAWLHDCGKITTPEHIIDKGTKLETIYNRIHEVRMRFEVLWRDAEIRYLEQFSSHDNGQDNVELKEQLQQYQQQLQDDFHFIAQCNVGSEFLSQLDIERLQTLAETTWQRHFDDRVGLSPVETMRIPDQVEVTLPVTESLLRDKAEHIIPREQSTDYDPKLGIKMTIPNDLYNLGELYNLSVSAGTLTKEDRFKINEHMISTVKMLESLPFPPELAKVPRYATTHHETMRGTGYPRGLSAPDLSMPERIMVVADVFEALTASDRPYKEAKPISEAVGILHKLVVKGNIDADVFELFLNSGVYRQYAKRFLPASQLDEFDIAPFLR